MTPPRARTRPGAHDVIDLAEAGHRVRYSPQYLRKLIWTDPHPPPFRKERGRWVCDADELDAWIAAREERAAC
jgi:hypothetical protein